MCSRVSFGRAKNACVCLQKSRDVVAGSCYIASRVDQSSKCLVARGKYGDIGSIAECRYKFRVCTKKTVQKADIWVATQCCSQIQLLCRGDGCSKGRIGETLEAHVESRAGMPRRIARGKVRRKRKLKGDRLPTFV